MMEFSEFAASIGLSELQLSLGLIGFSLLVVVMIYNALHLRKTEQSSSVSSLTIHDELSNINSKTEPSLDLPTAKEEIVIAPKIWLHTRNVILTENISPKTWFII